jgi:8-amino-7-oxononanoate synthase
MKEAPPLQQVDRTYVVFKGRKLSYFSGCDYFRLASHPKVLKAIETGLKKIGLNVAASRITTGNHPIYPKLELALKKFFRAEDALLVSSGYAANSVVAQALAGEFSHVLLDAEAHPSLVDAAQFFNAPVMRFESRDVSHLKRVIERCGRKGRFIVLTDGMFSRDGTVAPLKEYLKILPRDSWLLVDDAHGAGTLGENGRGSVEVTGISRARVIQTITLSKAFGIYGGAVLGRRDLRQKIFARSKMFIGSTPFPPPLAAGVLESMRILGSDKTLRRRLNNNFAYVTKKLGQPNVSSERSGPIIAFPPGTPRQSAAMTKRLLAAGIYPPLTRYTSANGYFRFVISSEHTRKQLDDLVAALIR